MHKIPNRICENVFQNQAKKHTADCIHHQCEQVDSDFLTRFETLAPEYHQKGTLEIVTGTYSTDTDRYCQRQTICPLSSLSFAVQFTFFLQAGWATKRPYLKKAY